jgi:hypothetical protein
MKESQLSLIHIGSSMPNILRPMNWMVKSWDVRLPGSGTSPCRTLAFAYASALGFSLLLLGIPLLASSILFDVFCGASREVHVVGARNKTICQRNPAAIQPHLSITSLDSIKGHSFPELGSEHRSMKNLENGEREEVIHEC